MGLGLGFELGLETVSVVATSSREELRKAAIAPPHGFADDANL